MVCVVSECMFYMVLIVVCLFGYDLKCCMFMLMWYMGMLGG